MDAIAYENSHYGYMIRNVEYSESALAENRDEISLMVDPLSGEVHFNYDPKVSGNLQYEQFWDSAVGTVSGRYGIITGQSMTPQGIRYFSISLDRGTASGQPRNIHVYVSKPNASESPAPDDTSFTGSGK